MSDSSSAAGPSSSRITPVRSLRQPALLQIATRDDAGGLTPPARSDAVALKLAMGRKVDFRRKGERWMDRFCEGTVGKEEFKRGAKYIEHHQYVETLHERHLNSLCSYPLCPNPPAAPYSSRPRWSISTAKRAITEKEGNAEEGFCSRVCRVRSEWVGEQLQEGAGLRGTGWVVELMEDLRPDVAGPSRSGVTRNGAKEPGIDTVRIDNDTGSSPSNQASAAAASGESNGPRSTIARAISQSGKAAAAGTSSSSAGPLHTGPPHTPTASSSDGSRASSAHNKDSLGSKAAQSRSADTPKGKIAPTASQVQDLIANLVIHERPTTIPLSTGSSDISRPTDSPSGTPQPLPNPSALIQQNKATLSRPPGSSLISTPTKLASNLISASRGLNPVPQLDADSDAESELSDWEVEMDGFGLRDEERALFEQMREAREMLDEDGVV